METRVSHLFQMWVVNSVSGFCETNDMRFKRDEVPDPICPCCNWTEVKETALHQLHYPALQSIKPFKDIMDSLHQCMKGQET